MRKIGNKGKSNPLLTVLLILGIVVLVAFLGSYFGLFGQTQGIPGVSPTPSSGTTIVTTGNIVSISGQDALSQGTIVGSSALAQSAAPGTTAFTGFGTLTSGTTQFTPGTSLNILLTNGTTYHNSVVRNHVVPTGTSDPIAVMFNKNASVTESYVYSLTNLVIGNNGVGNNITGATGVGASITLQDSMYGTSLASTQDMTCLIELTAGVNATSTPSGVTFTGPGAVPNTQYATSTPAWYNTQGSNSRVWAFDIPPITSAGATQYTIVATALSTKTFPAGNKIIKTCYTKENFIDPNTGQLTYAVADSNNNVKSIAVYSFTGLQA